MSLLEALLFGPGYLLAFCLVGYSGRKIAEGFNRSWAETTVVVVALALAAIVVWFFGKRLTGGSVTLFEAATYGPFCAFLIGLISYPLLDVARATGWPWAGNVAIGTAMLLATLAIWIISNFPPRDDAPDLPPDFDASISLEDWKKDFLKRLNQPLDP